MSIDHEASPPAVPGLDPVAPGDEPDDDPRSRLGVWVDNLIDWFVKNWPSLLVFGGVTWYFLYYAHLTIEVHRGYGTSGFDIGVFDQGLWKLSRFKNPEVTITGRNLFGDHTTWILIPFAPIYWFFPNPATLLWFQALFMALPAIPIYWVARRRIGDAMGSILAVAYLLHPAVGFSNMENYHPDSFLAFFIALALYAAIEDRRVMFVIMCVLCMLVKEDVVLVILPLAVWYAWRRQIRLGSLVAVASLIWAYLSFKVIRTFNSGVDLQSGARVPFGGSLRGAVETFYRQPGTVYEYVKSEKRPFYLWQMGAPFAFVFLISPEIAAISGLVLLWNVMSTFGYQHLIGYHYQMVVVPILAMGTVWAVSRLKTHKHQVIAVVAVALSALWSFYLWGPQSWSRDGHEYPHYLPSNPAVVATEQIRKQIPDNAVVSAYYSYVPHIGHRDRIYMWPVPWAASNWGLLNQEGENLGFGNDIEYVMLPTQMAANDQKIWDTIKSQFEVVASNTSATLYKRIAPGP